MFTFIHKYIKTRSCGVFRAKSATGVSLKFFMNLFVKVELNDTNPTAHKKTSFSKSEWMLYDACQLALNWSICILIDCLCNHM